MLFLLHILLAIVLLNFSYFIYFFTPCILLFFLIDIVLNKYIEYQLLFDLNTRCNLNVFLWDIMYFSWTNITYIFSILIPFLFLIYMLLFSFKAQHYKQVYLIILAIFFMAYTFINSNYCLDLSPTPTKLDYYNTLLINSLNKYHPLILYSVWLSIFIPQASVSNINRPLTNHYSINYKAFNALQSSSISIILTLFFGSWWAYQEGSWGGWWNWDPSEVFGLYIMLSVTYVTHALLNNYRFPIVTTIFYLLALSSLIYYCFMQMNFSLISHNFGFRDFDLVDIRLFYALLLSIISACAVVYACYSKYFQNHFSLHTYEIPFRWAFIFIYVTTVVLIVLSLLVLLNDLLWKIFRISLLNVSTSYTQLLLVIIIVYAIRLKTTNTLCLILILIFMFFSHHESFILLALPAVHVINYSTVHTVILISLLISILYTKFALSNWLTIKLGYFSYDYMLQTIFNADLTATYPFISECLGLSHSFSYTTFMLTTSPEIKTFFLPISFTSTFQCLLSDHTINMYTFLSKDALTPVLLTTLFIYIVSLLMLLCKPKLILL